MPGDGVAFSLKHTASGLYLAIRGNVTYAGGEAILTDLSHGYTPQWYLRREQDAHYFINASAPDMCLNVAYERTTVGGNLQQWSCNGGASELWYLIPTPGGTFQLVNKNSRLAVGSASSEDGSASTQRWPGDRWAQWAIQKYDTVTQILESPVDAASGTSTSMVGDHSSCASTLADEMIYNIYVPIFSSAGNLSAVTQDLPRIAEMGFSTILLMPIHPIGAPTGRHPAVGSPYAVADFYAIEPTLGRLSDFASLVNLAHVLGLKVIMDVVLNHTAWNHPFVNQRPTWYVHSDKKTKKSDSIAQAFWFEDVAQLDFKSGTAVVEFVATMLVWWIKNYQVDGFRFDTVDNPYGDNRMIPASAWEFIGKSVKVVNPGAILLGECTNPDLSLKPFNMDYTNYSLQPAIVSATRSHDARNLPNVINELKRNHPSGMLHCSIMQTWDMDLDLRMYGGPDQTLAAAVFNFSIEGVPMLFAGEEVGNDRGGVNTHSLINWNGPFASRFQAFYRSLGTLRRHRSALRRGTTTWLKVSGAGIGLIAFIRTYQSQQCLMAINFSTSSIHGNIQGVSDSGWIEVTPPGAAYATVHPKPPSVQLGPWDFALSVRTLNSCA